MQICYCSLAQNSWKRLLLLRIHHALFIGNWTDEKNNKRVYEYIEKSKFIYLYIYINTFKSQKWYNITKQKKNIEKYVREKRKRA